MAKDMPRRGFLKRILAGAAGAALLPLEARAAERVYEPVIVNVGLLENTKYLPEAFELARQYFADEVGLNFHFDFCDREDVLRGKAAFNSRTRIGIVERTRLEAAEDIVRREFQAEIDAHYGGMTRNQFIGMLKHHGYPANADEENILAQMGAQKQYELKEEMRYGKRRIAQKEFELREVAGDASMKEGIVRLIEHNNVFLMGASKEFTAKSQAMRIVHELGHMFGLWHTFDYSNDKIDDMVGDIPNVMSYEALPGKGKHGFAMNETQKQTIRDFVSGREPYQIMKKAGFHYGIYCELMAQRNGYKELKQEK